jgi:hypothetical protein
MEMYGTSVAQEANSVARPFNIVGTKGKRPESAGIRTGSTKIVGGGFNSLDTLIYGTPVKEIIDRDFSLIKQILETWSYDTIVYSASSKTNKLLGSKVFKFGPGVRKYITQQIHLLGTQSSSFSGLPNTYVSMSGNRFVWKIRKFAVENLAQTMWELVTHPLSVLCVKTHNVLRFNRMSMKSGSTTIRLLTTKSRGKKSKSNPKNCSKDLSVIYNCSQDKSKFGFANASTFHNYMDRVHKGKISRLHHDTFWNTITKQIEMNNTKKDLQYEHYLTVDNVGWKNFVIQLTWEEIQR